MSALCVSFWGISVFPACLRAVTGCSSGAVDCSGTCGGTANFDLVCNVCFGGNTAYQFAYASDLKDCHGESGYRQFGRTSVCVCVGGGNTDQRCPISQAWSCGTEAHLSLFPLFLLVILTRVFHVFNGHPDDHRRLKWNGTENMFIFMCVRARARVCVCVCGGGGVERDRQTDTQRQTDAGQTDGQREKDRERQTDRQIDRQTHMLQRQTDAGQRERACACLSVSPRPSLAMLVLQSVSCRICGLTEIREVLKCVLCL